LIIMEDPMARRFVLWTAVLSLVSAAPRGNAQTSFNPDISIIPQFLIATNDGERLPGRRVFSTPDLSFEELELVAGAYVNPFARADVVLALSGPDLETASLGLEEVYGTIVRGLPLDLNARFGKYRIEFGKLNMVHPHALPFATQPLVAQRFFGEDGLNDLAISASVLLPTGETYTRLNLDLLRGTAIGEATGIDDTSGAKPTYAVSGRLMSFLPLGETSDCEVGLSAYTGIHDPFDRDRFWYANLDFKYKWKPDSYTSLVVQGEWLVNLRHAHRDRELVPFTDDGGNPVRRSITSAGMYFFADYQFFKVYSAGGRLDWAESPYHADDRAWAVAVFAGYYPVEETLGLRLHYQHTRTTPPRGDAASVNWIGLQAVLSIGPHKAHPF